MTAREMIERFFQGVPLRKPLDNEKSVIDVSAITERLGWRATSAFAGE